MCVSVSVVCAALSRVDWWLNNEAQRGENYKGERERESRYLRPWERENREWRSLRLLRPPFKCVQPGPARHTSESFSRFFLLAAPAAAAAAAPHRCSSLFFFVVRFTPSFIAFISFTLPSLHRSLTGDRFLFLLPILKINFFFFHFLFPKNLFLFSKWFELGLQLKIEINSIAFYMGLLMRSVYIHSLTVIC